MQGTGDAASSGLSAHHPASRGRGMTAVSGQVRPERVAPHEREGRVKVWMGRLIPLLPDGGNIQVPKRLSGTKSLCFNKGMT